MTMAKVKPSVVPDSFRAASDTDIEDVIQGMKYASLAITDDKEGTLKNIGKLNPWQVQALKIITGSEEEAHKPLTYLLKQHLNLKCDTIIDISGLTKGGHFLDTQGYIAHNDDVIVLSFRCTTSIFGKKNWIINEWWRGDAIEINSFCTNALVKDWLTNLNSTSSEWEIEVDVAQGFSGFASGLEGLCCNSAPKPRVHTGFYNNFLATVPLIKQYIDPLLKADQPARKLYVVGHSLGAGIATLAACYFLLEYDWNTLPHSLVGVTAGSPRSCLSQMKEIVDSELEKKSSNTKMLRVVRNKDVVATVPPAILGFHHLGRLVYIAEDGSIHFDSDSPEQSADVDRVKESAAKYVPRGEGETKSTADADQNEDGQLSKYEKKVNRIPKAFRDHMPDFYLTPMKHYRENLFPVEKVVSNSQVIMSWCIFIVHVVLFVFGNLYPFFLMPRSP